MILERRKWFVAGAVALAVLGACGGGGGDDGDKASSASGATHAAADDSGASAEADAGFSCPVTLADVETAYAPVQFKDADLGEDNCTFVREDDIGSVAIQVTSGDAKTTYDSELLPMADKETVEGVGDEAAYSPGFTMLVARAGDKVLTITAVTMVGVGGEDASSDRIQENIKNATVSVGAKSAANV